MSELKWHLDERAGCQVIVANDGSWCCPATDRELELIAQVQALCEQVAAYKRLIPQECCNGTDTNCHGPRGCLVRAVKAEFTAADALVAQVEARTDERDRAREIAKELGRHGIGYPLSHDVGVCKCQRCEFMQEIATWPK